MNVIYKKIISFALVIATTFSLCFTASAVEFSSVSATDWWDFLVHSAYTAGKDAPNLDAIPIGWLNSALCSRLSGEICLSSDDGWHHGTEIYDYNVNTGNGVAICTYCGNRFKFSAASYLDAYQDYVSSLDNIYVDSDSSSSLTWSLSSFTSRDNPSVSYSYGLNPPSGKLTGSSVGNNLATFEFKSSYFSVPSDGEYTFSIPFSGFLAQSLSYGVFSLCSPSGSTVKSSMQFVGGSFSRALSFSATLDSDSSYYLTLQVNTNTFGDDSDSFSFYFDSGPVSTSPNIFTTSSGSGANTRPAALMEAVNDYNASSSGSKYYLGTADSGDQITNVYAPNIFNESSKVFTEPITGTQYLCTYWQYVYFSDSIGLYRLELSDGTYVTSDGLFINTIFLYYYNDRLIIYYFDESADDLFEDDVIGPGMSDLDLFFELCDYQQTYYYVVSDSSACQHEFTSEVTTAPTCEEPGVTTYTCSICGYQYTEEISPLGHDFISEVTIEPTCEDPGETTYTCSICGYEYTEQLDPLGHDWRLVGSYPAEFDDEGKVTGYAYTLYECSRCKEQYKDYASTGPPQEDDDSWLDWLLDLFKSLIEALVNGLASGLEYLVSTVIVTVTDLIIQTVRWVMGLFDVDALLDFFNWFSDDTMVFQNEFGEEADVWAYS